MTEKVLGFGKSSWWGCVLAWNQQPGLELEVTGGGKDPGTWGRARGHSTWKREQTGAGWEPGVLLPAT